MAKQTTDATFWDHLEDLRRSLIRMAAALICVTAILLFFKEFLFGYVILAPTQSSFYLYELLGVDMDLSLINIDVTSQFMVHMKVSFVCALILTFPYIVYELWRFVSPALYENEKKNILKAFAFSCVMFYIGLAVGYYVILPLMVNFFAEYQVTPDVKNTFSLTSYISLLTSTVFAFGLVFQFPSVISILSSLGLVTKDTLRTYRRHAICLVVIVAALITPSGDPFSLLVCTIPLYILYEFSILLCRSENNTEK